MRKKKIATPPSISPASIKLRVQCIFNIMQDFVAVVNAFIAHVMLLLMVLLK